MADNDAKPSGEQVAAFLGQLSLDSACPICKNSGWTIVPAPDDPRGHAAVPLFAPDGAFVAPPPSLPVYALICGSCGYVRLHSKRFVDAAILKQS